MRMATRRRRRWIAIGGATAAVAIGVWAAVALAAPTGVTRDRLRRIAPVRLAGRERGARCDGLRPRARGRRVPGEPRIATVASTGAGDVASRTTRRRGDGDLLLPGDGHYGDRDAPATSARHGAGRLRRDVRRPCRCSPRPAAGATLHAPVDASPRARRTRAASRSTSLDDLGGRRSARCDGRRREQRDALVDTAGRQLHAAERRAVDRADNHVDGDDPGHRRQHAPAGVPGLRALRRSPGEPDALLVVAGGPYTFTITRDGTASCGSRSASPWTDPSNPRAGHAHLRRDRDRRARATRRRAAVYGARRRRRARPRRAQLSAASPTNAVPHLTWQPPVTFAVTSWQIYPRRRRR